VWQGLHAELAPSGFTVVAVALDTGGPAAVAPWIRPADLATHCPPPLRAIMGHSEEDWARAGVPEYPCLIDRQFDVSRAYGILNVPTAVWIDESGTVMRGPEAAGVNDGVRQLDMATFALPPDVEAGARELRTGYFDAIRDWVAHGPDSRFVGSTAAARPAPTAEERYADAAFRLGTHLQLSGDPEAAQRHFDEARAGRQFGFAYHRQARVLADPDLTGELDLGIFGQLATLGDQHFYEPIDL
jgi:hypothetical protein